MELKLTNIKTNRALSEETQCFSATLFVDGKKAGTVGNRGTGGCHDYRWLDPKFGQTVEEWAKTQKTQFKFEQLDELIDGLLGRIETEKQMKRWMKTKTCFRLKDDEKGSWRTIPLAMSKTVEAAVNVITAKYGDKVEMILTTDNLASAMEL